MACSDDVKYSSIAANVWSVSEVLRIGLERLGMAPNAGRVGVLVHHHIPQKGECLEQLSD